MVPRLPNSWYRQLLKLVCFRIGLTRASQRLGWVGMDGWDLLRFRYLICL